MTKDEAREILRFGEGLAYIQWDDEDDCPRWNDYAGEPTITLDGEFSVKELMALIVFAGEQQ